MMLAGRDVDAEQQGNDSHIHESMDGETADPRIGEHADAMARLRKPDRQRMGGEPDAPTGGHPQEPLARRAV